MIGARPMATLMLVAVSACLGRYERTGTARTLPFHEDERALARYPPCVGAPPRIRVAPDVRFAPVIGYHAMPVGMFVSDASEEVTLWSPLEAAAPEADLRDWFEGSVEAGTGPRRHVHAVITQLQWYVFEGRFNAGRVATTVAVTTEDDATVVFSGSLTTRARASQLDELLAAHVTEWLRDGRFLAALEGGGR